MARLSSTIALQLALGQVALRTRSSWKVLSLVPACSGLRPQTVLDAGAPKCKSISYCSPCILHASVQGTQKKSVLHGKGLFIFPVMQHNVVGNRQTVLCQEKCVTLRLLCSAQPPDNKGRELPRGVAPLPKSSD